jgi:hypothetical protein
VNEFIQQLSTDAGGTDIGTIEAFFLFSQSIILGSFLMGLTLWVNSKNETPKDASSEGAENSKNSPSTNLMTAGNVLFICIGMTAVMILVGNNLARAFAIGAAIALVRFRVKVEGKFIGMALLYGVLTGMACGIGRVDIAWTVAITFGVVLLAMMTLQRTLFNQK